MATQKINFTKEHKVRLEQLALMMLFGNLVIKGPLGNEYNIQTLLHQTTIGTLQTTYSNLKKEIEKLEGLDTWSQTEYQQQKLAQLKETQELVNLIIGYKKYQAQVASDKQQLAALKAELKELEESNITPEEKIKALKAKIEGFGSEEAFEAAPEAQATQ